MRSDNSKYLKPNSERTPQERKELAAKAGKASGEARQRKRMIRDALLKALTGEYETLDGALLNGYDAMAVTMIMRAVKGDVQAFKEVRDTIGEKPTDVVGFEDSEITGINIKFVNKSNKRGEDKDPKIVGEYTPPSNIEEE